MESTATAEGFTEPIPERSDYTKAKRHVFNRHLAHEAVMLDEMQKTKARAARLERFAATGNVDDLMPSEGEEEMGVSIGNENHWHIQMAQPQATESKAAAVAATVARGGFHRFVLPLLLGGGMIAAGACGMAIYNYFFAKPEAVTTINQPAGQFDYSYGIESKPY